jgi:hypothetical protein
MARDAAVFFFERWLFEAIFAPSLLRGVDHYSNMTTR